MWLLPFSCVRYWSGIQFFFRKVRKEKEFQHAKRLNHHWTRLYKYITCHHFKLPLKCVHSSHQFCFHKWHKQNFISICDWLKWIESKIMVSTFNENFYLFLISITISSIRYRTRPINDTRLESEIHSSKTMIQSINLWMRNELEFLCIWWFEISAPVWISKPTNVFSYQLMWMTW